LSTILTKGMEDTLECADITLELLVLILADLLLGVLISISMFILYCFNRLEWILVIKRNNVFVNFLLGITI